MSHEIRLSSPTDRRLRYVGGLFYEKRELNGQTDWQYKSVPECAGHRACRPAAASCTSIRVHAPKFQSATGDMNNPNRRNARVGFLQRLPA